MQLLYLWIEESYNGVIQDQNFNFSGELFFSYNKNLRCLKARSKKNYVSNFFSYGTSIIDVTAVIGKNGSGKTTLLRELLKLNFIINSDKAKKMIIAYKDDDEIKIWTTTYINTPIDNNTDFSISVFPIKNFCEFNNSIVLVSNTFYDFDKTLFSINHGNIDNLYFTTSSLVDTASFLYREKFEWNKERIIDQRYEWFKELYIPPSESYNRFETEQQIKYVIKNYSNLEKLKFSLPDEIFFSLGIIREKDIQRLKSLRISDESNKHIKKIYDTIQKYLELYKRENRYNSRDLAYQVFFCLLVESEVVLDLDYGELKKTDLNSEIENYIGHLEVAKKRNKAAHYSSLEEWQKRLLTDEDKIIEDRTAVFDYYINACNELIAFANKFHNIKLNNNGWDKDDLAYREYLSLNIQKDSDLINIILEFLDQKQSFISKYIKLEWRKLSDGEYAFLALFSRIYWSLHNYDYNFHKDIILLIDEIDLYFHPEWQRNLIDFLVNDLQYISNNKIQIIYSTHSPITLSDMPKGNVIFLMNKQGNCIVDDLANHQQTFGANIYSLYADSFFMDHTAPIGSYAKLQIDKIIHKIKSGELLNSYDKDILEQIGDSVIKNTILGMYRNLRNEK